MLRAPLIDAGATAVGAVVRGRAARRAGGAVAAATQQQERRHRAFMGRLRAGIAVDKRSARKRALQQRVLRLEGSAGLGVGLGAGAASAMRLVCGRRAVPLSAITEVEQPPGDDDEGWIVVRYRAERPAAGAEKEEEVVEATLTLKLRGDANRRTMLLEVLRSCGCPVSSGPRTVEWRRRSRQPAPLSPLPLAVGEEADGGSSEDGGGGQDGAPLLPGGEGSRDEVGRDAREAAGEEEEETFV
jgi:hypothetical protein